MRRFMILNNIFDVPLTFLCDLHHTFNFNCLNLVNINNSNHYYINPNKYYTYNYNLENKELEFSLNKLIEAIDTNDITNDIKKALETKNEIIMIQKERNTKEADIINSLISGNTTIEKNLNSNTYNFKYKDFDSFISFNSYQYKLNSYIINDNNEYLYLYNTELTDKYDVNSSPSLVAIYALI